MKYNEREIIKHLEEYIESTYSQHYTKGDFPYSLGLYGTEAVIKHLRGESYESEINMDERGPVPGLINKAILDKYPDFKGEWKG